MLSVKWRKYNMQNQKMSMCIQVFSMFRRNQYRKYGEHLTKGGQFNSNSKSYLFIKRPTFVFIQRTTDKKKTQKTSSQSQWFCYDDFEHHMFHSLFEFTSFIKKHPLDLTNWSKIIDKYSFFSLNLIINFDNYIDALCTGT